MSVHGACFDNGDSGRCGVECEELLNGRCDIGDEMLEDALDSDQLEEEVKLELIDFYGE